MHPQLSSLRHLLATFGVACAVCLVAMLATVPAEAQLAGTAVDLYGDRQRGVTLELPSHWDVEDLERNGGLLLSSPVERDGRQAHVFLELRPEFGQVTIDELADVLVEELQSSKANLSIDVHSADDHPSGSPSLTLVYSYDLDGLRLVETMVILWFDTRSPLLVTGSALADDWDGDLDRIERLIFSLRPMQARSARAS
ncbi:MAG: hypothetical protein AAGN46_08700 [Acidobacteriota bacterium]